MVSNKSRYSYYTALAWCDSCSFLFDSSSDNIINTLTLIGYEMYLSPIHNNDYNEDGSNKKHHRHIIVKFPYSVTYDKARSEIESMNFQFGQHCKSLSGSLQYFIHKNNPDKAQYSLDNCLFINCSKDNIIKKYFSDDMLDTDVFVLLQDIINNYNVKSIKQLIDIIISDYRHCDFLFKWVVKNVYFIEKYLKGGF